MTDIRIYAKQTVSEADLHAYVDGQLDAVRRAQVEAHLAAHPEDAARINAYNAQTLGMHVLFSGADLPDNRELDALTAQLDTAVRRRKTMRTALRAAVVAGVMVTATGVAWSLHGQFTKSENPFLAFTRQATDAHMLFAGRHQESPDAKAGDGPTVVSWLSQRLTGIPLRAPDLRSLGYALTVERILPSADGPAAQLMYEHDKEKLPITLFIGKNRLTRQTEFTFVRNDEVSIFYWHDGPLAYSLAGRLERQTLLELAEEISAQLNAVPPLPKRVVRQPRPGSKHTAQASPGPSTLETERAKATPDEAARSAAELVQPVAEQRPTSDDAPKDRTRAIPAPMPAATKKEPAAPSESPAPRPITAPGQEEPKKT